VQAAGSAQAKAMNHSERVLHIETSDKRARSVAEPTGCRGAQYTAPARKTALIGDERTKARQIDVETYRGDVQLNGFVDSAAAKTAAASVAQNVDGVTKVTNNLQVGADRTSGEVVDDSTINSRVRAALIGDERTKSHQIEVDTNAGVVNLGGFVDTAANKTAAAQLAGDVSGVTRVNNRLEVRTN
jgi:hyperosmotically inducible protein